MTTHFECPVDETEVARIWHERGFDCERKLDEIGLELVDYLHDVDELHVVLKGEMEFSFGEITLHPAIGEEVFVPAGSLHTVKNVGSEPLQRLRGHFVIKS